MNPTEIFDAARNGDVATLRACLEAGADLTAVNEYGFTALHCAAMGTNTADEDDIITVLRLLIDAGAPLESIGGSRTALYLAAEFSLSVGPVKYLIEAGANPNITDEHGHNIVENAMAQEVKELLSRITEIPISPPPLPPCKVKKLTTAQWRKIKPQIDMVFEKLSQYGLVALQDAGYSQEDGLDDCVEVFHDRGANNAGLHGFCFYTRQDLNRARRTSQLPLAYWGAPRGEPDDMERVARVIVETFRENGFTVDWDSSDATRPIVVLQ